MIEQGTSQKEEKKIHKVVLILLVGLAAISGARKDLNQLLALAHDVHALAEVVGVLPTGQPPTVASATCQAKVRAVVPTTSEFGWRARVEQGNATKTKRLSRDLQPESDTRRKRITLTLPGTVRAQVAAETFDGAIPLELSMNLTDESKMLELHLLKTLKY